MLDTKKSIKQDPIKASLLRVIRFPTSSGYVLYGKTGSGKSVLMFSLSLMLHLKFGFKIWDIWGGKRNQGEGLYIALPSPYKEYWALIRKKFRFDNGGSRQIKTRFAYPLTRDMPKELPILKNDKDEMIVESKPFRIPIKMINERMIRHSLNNLSDSDITLWEEIRYSLKDSDGMLELDKVFEKKGKNCALWKNFFYPLVEMRILCSMDDDNVLDLKKEAKDREKAFVLVLHHIPDKFKLFVMGFIMFGLWDLMNYGKISGRNVVNLREATEFFRATEKSVVEDRYKRFKIDLSEFIRQARGRFAFILDAQSPDETSGIVPGSWDYEIIGRLPSENDRKIATDQLKRDGKITPRQVSDLGELDKGEYYFIENGKDAKKRYCFLPPCDFWKESDKDFYSIWKNRNGVHSFKNFSDLIKHIDDEFKLKMNQIKEEQKQKKADHEAKEKIRKEIEEDRKLREMAEREKKIAEIKLSARKEAREKLKKPEEPVKEDAEKSENIKINDSPLLVWN